MVKTLMIRLQVIEGPNALDQIMFCAFHSFLDPVYMEWGTPVQWGRFLLFCVLQSVKTKETNPTRPGSPTPCKQALSGSPNECWLHTCDACIITIWRLELQAPLVACKSPKPHNCICCC